MNLKYVVVGDLFHKSNSKNIITPVMFVLAIVSTIATFFRWVCFFPLLKVSTVFL